MESSNISEEQILNITIAWVEYDYKMSSWYLSKKWDTLKIGERIVTALFPWDDNTFLAHVDGRLFHIPALISKDGTNYKWISTAIDHLKSRISHLASGIVSRKSKKENT